MIADDVLVSVLDLFARSAMSDETKHEVIEWCWVNNWINSEQYQQLHDTALPPVVEKPE